MYFSRLSLWSNLNISNRPICGYRLTQSKCMWHKGSTNQNICGIQVKSTTVSVLKRFTQTNITWQAGFVYALQLPTQMIKDHTSFWDHLMVSLNTEATNKEVRIVVKLTQVGWVLNLRSIVVRVPGKYGYPKYGYKLIYANASLC